MNAGIEIARPLIDAGLHVFLLRGKKPALRVDDGGQGYKDATRDIAVLRDVAARYPDATNVGIQPGLSGILVVDLDEAKDPSITPAIARLNEVATANGGMPDTLTVRTGSGGRHLYFWAPITRDIGQINGIRNPDTGRTQSGVDARCGVGYVVAPGSIHPDTGRPYVWETPSGRFERDRIVDAPAWLVDFLQPVVAVAPDAPPGWTPPTPTTNEQARVAGAIRRACDRLAGLGPGDSRRTELQRAAYALGGWLWTGYPEADLRRALQDAARACGHWDRDTERVIDYGIETGSKANRPLPPDDPNWNAPRRTESVLPEAVPWEAYEDDVRSAPPRRSHQQPQPEPAPVVDHLAALVAALRDADAGAARRLIAEFMRNDDAVTQAARALNERRTATEALLIELHVDGASAAVKRCEAAIRARARELEAEAATPDEPAMPRTPVAASDSPLIVHVPAGAAWFLRGSDDWFAVNSTILHTEVSRMYPDVDTWTTSAKGTDRPMSAEELYARYGRRGTALVYNMTAKESSFIPGPDGGGTLMLRCCQVDPNIRAEFSQEVDDWLTLLGGPMSDRLRDWLACSLYLDRPICALYLEGERSDGKGFIVSSLASMFGHSVTSYADVVGTGFNSALKQCPIVHVDEKAPRMANGSAGFRNLISESERPLTEKFKPTGTIRGCIRLVITANNPDALRLSEEELTRADEEAIAIRILHIPTDGSAGEYLAGLGGREATDHWIRTPDGMPGKVPNHIAWLVENWQVTQRGQRFLVEGDADDWFKSSALRSGLPRTVLHVLAWAASGGDQWDEVRAIPGIATEERPVFYREGEAWVRTEWLVQHWDRLAIDDSRKPSATALGTALGRVGMDAGHAVRRAVEELEMRRVMVHRISADHILTAAETSGIGDLAKIRKRFGLKPEPEVTT